MNKGSSESQGYEEVKTIKSRNLEPGRKYVVYAAPVLWVITRANQDPTK